MAAIRDTRPPSNLKQIREFVGLANHFRFLIKDFSKMSAPMTALTKKDSGWKEGKLPEEAYQAFLGLKEELMQQPIVAFPKREGRFMLRKDVCLGGQGQRRRTGSSPATATEHGSGRPKSTEGHCIRIKTAQEA
jgi:hypothetical protein